MLTGWGLDVEEQHCMSALWPLLLLGQHSGIYMMRLLAWFIAWLIVPMIALCIKGTRSVTQLGSDRAESALCKYVCDRRCDMSCNWSLWWSHTHSTRRANTVMIVLCNHIWLLRPFFLCPTQWLWVGHCDGHWWNVVGGLLCDGVGGGRSACLDVGSLGTAAGFSASRLWCKVALHGPHTMMVSWKGVGKVSSDPSRTPWFSEASATHLALAGGFVNIVMWCLLTPARMTYWFQIQILLSVMKNQLSVMKKVEFQIPSVVTVLQVHCCGSANTAEN